MAAVIKNIVESPRFRVDYKNGNIVGQEVQHATKYLKDLTYIFEDKEAFNRMSGNKAIYKVQYLMPVKEETEGGLFYGNTIIEAGKVGDEFFMTKGHFHSTANRGEFYWGIQGQGILLLMDKKRNVRGEKMVHGSLHYIDGYIAHRVVNTGDVPLNFGACWPSDAGHNYDEIVKNGFSARVKEVKGVPTIVSI